MTAQKLKLENGLQMAIVKFRGKDKIQKRIFKRVFREQSRRVRLERNSGKATQSIDSGWSIP
jgi:hypothetical protein